MARSNWQDRTGFVSSVAHHPDTAVRSRSTLSRLPLLGLALLALLGALWGGLLRIGWQWPLLHPPLVMGHGPLIVSGFLGTVVSMERAVALNRRWAYAGPLLSGAGALLLLLGVGGWPGPLLITLSSVILVLIFGAIIRQHPAIFTVVMLLGALAWCIGNLLWLGGRAIPQIVLWWQGFLIITIVGERLELSRLLRLTRGRMALFMVALALLMAGMVITVWRIDIGVRVAGAAMIALAVWLSRYDLARRTVKKAGLTRFIAISLLSGYVWLGIGGALALTWGGVLAGPHYDALLHAVFVGFVISMIFGHAPIILPALLHLPTFYHRGLYVPLILLHASLALRIGGDVSDSVELRRCGGLLNALALLIFLGSVVWLVRRTQRTARLKR